MVRRYRPIEVVFLPGDEEAFGNAVKNEWKLKNRVPSDSLFGRKGRKRLTELVRMLDDTPVELEEDEG